MADGQGASGHGAAARRPKGPDALGAARAMHSVMKVKAASGGRGEHAASRRDSPLRGNEAGRPAPRS